MYNKIAQIILNSGKASGASGVFVSQPDSLKESLAGKIFVLGEVDGKKTEGEKIMNFIISDLNDNYYNDEKISLLGKIEGLKIENIFEAALAKMNKNLGEFLINQKIKLNSSATSLTVGVVYENKLYFASFGKNRALLIYRRSDGYEIINVETSAEDIADKDSAERLPKLTGLFASVISGEIPLGSYFIFTSETLPEYLSGREMVEIVTKLPPIVAAEQIKNILAKMNNYVPFLGIIIKNTTDSVGQEIKEPNEEALSAHTSISSLNSTEQRTEQMLAPAGIISFKKISATVQLVIKNLLPKSLPSAKKMNRSSALSTSDLSSNQGPAASQSSTRFESEKNNKLNLPTANSFSSPKKIRLKQTSYRFMYNMGKLFKASPNLVNKSFWSGFYSGSVLWIKSLNKKNKLLFVGLIIMIVGLTLSISLTRINSNRQKAIDSFNVLVAQIDDNYTTIERYILSTNEDGAASVLVNTKDLIEALPKEEKFQQDEYSRLTESFRNIEKKVYRITSVSEIEKITDLTSINVYNLAFADGKLYGAAGASIYTITLDTNAPAETKVDGATNIGFSKYDGSGFIYYRDGGKIIKLNIKDGKTTSFNIKDYNEEDGYSGFALYSGNFYQASRSNNQIYKYSGTNFSVRANWRKEAVNVSNAKDLFIDGAIYVLNSDGSLSKYHAKLSKEYTSRPLTPTVSASKILGDTKQFYVLDSATKRIAVIAKEDGHLMNQYVFDSLGDLKDFALDENGKIIYLLSSEGVYKFAL
jgi:hypothetical protein